MGSNEALKRMVAEGKLCYICEKNPPELTDEIGGKICQECHKAIQAMRLTYALQDGYTQKGDTTDATRGIDPTGK